jgi:hypothetical protein
VYCRRKMHARMKTYSGVDVPIIFPGRCLRGRHVVVEGTYTRQPSSRLWCSRQVETLKAAWMGAKKTSPPESRKSDAVLQIQAESDEEAMAISRKRNQYVML